MAKNLDLFLSVFGRDETGGLFSSITRKAGQLRGAMGMGAEGVGGAMRDSILQAEIFTRVFDAGMSVVTAGVGALKGSIEAASSAQLDLLTATSSFSAIAGVSFDDAEASIRRVNDTLAKNAATLPGTTQDYKDLAVSINDNVLPVFKGIDGSLNFTGLEEGLASLSTSFGALGATSQVATNDISKGLSKALSGKSISELGDLLFFEQNPAILSAIETGLAERNVETLKDLDIKTRFDLLNSIGEKFISDEFKAGASESFEGLLEGFKTTLFDPTAGIFGLTRDLFADIEGEQSAFSAITELLRFVVGPGGMLAADGPMAELFEALGLDLPDPMRVLYNGVLSVTRFIERGSDMIRGISERLNSGLDASKAIRGFLSNLDGTSIGQSFGQLFGKMSREGYERFGQGVSQIPWAKLGMEAGEFLGSGTVNLIREFPWGAALASAGRGFIATADFLFSTLVGILKGVAVGIGDWIRDGAGAAKDATFKFFSDAPSNIWKSITNFDNTATSATITSGRRISARTSPVTPSSRRRPRGAAMGFSALGYSEADDILSLASKEKMAAPGAGLIIANDSERVIPRGASGNQSLTPGAGSAGRGGNISINFQPTLMLQSGTSKQMAEEVLGYLEQIMGKAMENQLA